MGEPQPARVDRHRVTGPPTFTGRLAPKQQQLCWRALGLFRPGHRPQRRTAGQTGQARNAQPQPQTDRSFRLDWSQRGRFGRSGRRRGQPHQQQQSHHTAVGRHGPAAPQLGAREARGAEHVEKMSFGGAQFSGHRGRNQWVVAQARENQLSSQDISAHLELEVAHIGGRTACDGRNHVKVQVLAQNDNGRFRSQNRRRQVDSAGATGSRRKPQHRSEVLSCSAKRRQYVLETSRIKVHVDNIFLGQVGDDSASSVQKDAVGEQAQQNALGQAHELVSGGGERMPTDVHVDFGVGVRRRDFVVLHGHAHGFSGHLGDKISRHVEIDGWENVRMKCRSSNGRNQ
ncbi:hypothetical protein CLUG_05717 [Clavispora lusitaniae ATCC 42720]|uniref:Uncharacterized protein n=1 Tax=Clavispora lusitaniae (strain ATCC 42720) TaxID=306902 RepID=C4YBY9_CLAL4|nr:uncharacterized protein CLUG_05717 [Clavispora lusitaniae ATCC 42720]EEQ41588.1 hypothetical protein CLUG_05717 [Clavispora lusitaniae ATCC 42720]